MTVDTLQGNLGLDNILNLKYLELILEFFSAPFFINSTREWSDTFRSLQANVATLLCFISLVSVTSLGKLSALVAPKTVIDCSLL